MDLPDENVVAGPKQRSDVGNYICRSPDAMAHMARTLPSPRQHRLEPCCYTPVKINAQLELGYTSDNPDPRSVVLTDGLADVGQSCARAMRGTEQLWSQ